MSDEKTCGRCNKSLADEDQYECEECGNVYCIDCILDLKNVGNLCKNCVDEVYPREKEVVEKVIEKIITPSKDSMREISFNDPIL